MPNTIITSFAKKYKKPPSQIEKFWDKAIEIAKDKGLSKNSKYYYSYVVGVLKKLLKKEFTK